jgi:hypothetical protein
MIVDGPKTAQLTPMSIGPRLSSPDDGIISFLSMATDSVKLRRESVQPSLILVGVVDCVVVGMICRRR